MKLLGWKVIGNPGKRFQKVVLIGAPHTTNWDGPLTLLISLSEGMPIRWLGKHTLFETPWGGLLRLLGGVPIDRSRSSGLVEQMVKEFEQADRLFLVMAPEGTRKYAPYWKTGFYHIAIAAGVPILMAKINYAEKRIYIEHAIDACGDIEKDFQIIHDYFQDAVGYHPENMGPVILKPE